MNIDLMTAQDFLNAKAKAKGNASDKPEFKILLQQLKASPREQELVFELLPIVLESIEAGTAKPIIMEVLYFDESIGNGRIKEYLGQIEQIVSCSFERITDESIGIGKLRALDLTLGLSLIVLHKRDKNRFCITLGTLKIILADKDKDLRSVILARIEKKCR